MIPAVPPPTGLRQRMRRWLGAPGAAAAEAGAAPAWRRPAEARFDLLFEHVGEALLRIAPDGRVLAANPRAAALWGRSSEDLCAEPLGRWLEQPGRPPAAMPAGGPALLLGADRAPRPVELRVCVLPPADDRPGADAEWLVAVIDDAAQRSTAARLAFLASYDSLTGLPNRSLFRDRLGQAMSRAERSGRPLALMFIDLDRFKDINDSLGHGAGDDLLQQVARLLTRTLREVDTVASGADAEPSTLSRLGGDEFTVIAEGLSGSEDAAIVARRLLEALQHPLRLRAGASDEVHEVVVGASIGISLYPTDDIDIDGLIRHTDMAMYRSKAMGRGTYSFFSDDLNAAVTARLGLESALRRATERLKQPQEPQEFSLHFQPKACLRSGEVTGVETLLRWNCPGKGLVPPERFIPVLEDTGMILPVGAWVIRAACEQMAAWDREGLPPLRVAVNLSPRQLRHLFLASMVEDTLRHNDLDPQRLEIELTESLMAEDSEQTSAMLASFERIGVRLALDDFGTGESSLSRIQRFRIDTLKIDRSFVRSIEHNPGDVAISTAVIALARSMSIRTVVAEGVETPGQAEVLRALGCDEIQGWLLSRPMPAADFVLWLRRHEHEARVARAAASDPAMLARIRVDLSESSVPTRF